MGVNYYIRRLKPREVYDQMHVGKVSCGYRTYFRDSDWGDVEQVPGVDEDDIPDFHSAGEIRELLASGEWCLVGENGNAYAPGEESVMAFDAIVTIDGMEPAHLPGTYKDGDGNLFTSEWFC